MALSKILIGPNSDGIADVQAGSGSSASGDLPWINIADHVTVYSDGVTDNLASFNSFNAQVQLLSGANTIPQTVTITIASPAVITWVDHGLRVNDAVVFSTTGALPTGITAGTPYYVISAGLTVDTFQIAATTSFLTWTGDGAAINTSGTQSGVHSIRVYGFTWTQILVPPGAYYGSNVMQITGFLRRARILAYGVTTYNLQFPTYSIIVNNSFQYVMYGRLSEANRTSNTVTMSTIADATRFHVGQWVCIMALDIQDQYGVQSSWPPNNHYFEYKQIQAINTGTGVITFTQKLENQYRTTYPLMYDSTRDSGSFGSGGGPATMFGFNDNWNMDLEVCGIAVGQTNLQTLATARNIRFRDCYFTSQGPVPSVSRIWEAENCTFSRGFAIEVDKLVEFVKFSKCEFFGLNGGLNIQSTSIDRLIVESCSMDSLVGTSKRTVVRDCDIRNMTVGPVGFGATSSVEIENSWISVFDKTTPIIDQFLGNPPTNTPLMVHNFTFSNGTLKQPIATTVANNWAVPGRAMYTSNATRTYESMGAPFQVLDVYVSGTDFCIDTTLEALPVGNSTSSVVTLTIASPGVVNWGAHGLTADTPVVFVTTGALPTGLVNNGIYYVLAAGLGAGTFRVGATAGGTAIDFTGSQSGVHTAYANPLAFRPHPCPRLTVRGCSGCENIIDASNAPPNTPMFSYAKRRLAGQIGGIGTTAYYDAMKNMGNLVSLKINVIKAYTGAVTPMELTITSPAFDSNLLLSTMTQVVDVRTAGLRIVTPDGVTGAAAGDTLTATGNWLSGNGTTAYFTTAPASLGVSPVVEIELVTDQGIMDPALAIAFGANMSSPVPFDDAFQKGIG